MCVCVYKRVLTYVRSKLDQKISYLYEHSLGLEF
jgi:hypothetical protein